MASGRTNHRVDFGAIGDGVEPGFARKLAREPLGRRER